MNRQIDPVAALKAIPAFANTSLRLLDDLAERLLQLDLADDGEEGSPGLATVLRGGALPPEEDGAPLWRRERALLEELLDASPALAHSVAHGAVEGLTGEAGRHAKKRHHDKRGRHDKPRRERRLVEVLWVCAARDCNVPIVALTHLLAAATARLFDEPAVVITLPDSRVSDCRLHRWSRDGVADMTSASPVGSLPELKEREIVKRVCDGPHNRRFHRVFVVDPEGREVPPLSLGPRRFHRIVYVTRTLPARMPSVFRSHLKGALFAGGATEPGFGAFIPSVVLPVSRPEPTSLMSAACKAADVADFRTMAIQDEAGGLDEPAPAGPGRRIVRDLCRMQLDVDAIGALWKDWVAGRLPDDDSFAAAVRRLYPSHGPSLDRWARAIANRQVGIGLSGGGACAYRAVPLLSILVRRLGVPIDVIGGVSGGSVVAAYFATYGLEGLRLAIERGSRFNFVVFASMFASRAIAAQVDADLGGTRIEELEMRFVPVTTKLPSDDRAPHGAVVVRGTCGAGVRVSGSAPGGFAPTEIRGSRFTDGFASTMIPGRVLRSYGADVVLACNCIPGPGEGQPLEESWLGRLCYHGVPFFGRMADAWVSIAYLFQETSRRAGADADVFVEFPSEDIPLLEMMQWGDALAIANRARSEHGTALWREAQSFADLCGQVGTRPGQQAGKTRPG
jgi:predicted acylesterase/phospholipase RssA